MAKKVQFFHKNAEKKLSPSQFEQQKQEFRRIRREWGDEFIVRKNHREYDYIITVEGGLFGGKEVFNEFVEAESIESAILNRLGDNYEPRLLKKETSTKTREKPGQSTDEEEDTDLDKTIEQLRDEAGLDKPPETDFE